MSVEAEQCVRSLHHHVNVVMQSLPEDERAAIYSWLIGHAAGALLASIGVAGVRTIFEAVLATHSMVAATSADAVADIATAAKMGDGK